MPSRLGSSLFQHQAVAEVVDVLAGAGEVHEFQGRGQLGVVLQLFLDEVLHRLDVMVGGALDLFHARGLDRGEVGGQGTQAGGGGLGERGQLDDARLGAQGQQPLDLDRDAGLDQAVFGKDRAQGIDLAGITAIERGQGEQGVIGHVGRAGASGGGHILRRCGLPRFALAGHGPALPIGRCDPSALSPAADKGVSLAQPPAPGSDPLPAAASLSPTEVVRSRCNEQSCKQGWNREVPYRTRQHGRAAGAR